MRTNALVLTYDFNRVCAENMILQYERLLGPDHFRFLIPCQLDLEISPLIRSEVRLVPSGPAIGETVAALLAAVGAQEMVYWCIDDKYPLDLDQAVFLATLAHIHTMPAVDGISLAMARRLTRGAGLNQRAHHFSLGGGLAFYPRTNFNQFWLHQFMRAKCIAHVFSRFSGPVAAAKEMDASLDRIAGNPFRMYVAGRNGIVFGESTSRGAMTEHFIKTALANGLAIPPERARTEQAIRIGRMGETVRFRRRWSPF